MHSNATSLVGQQSLGSLVTPTPRDAPPSIFSRTQQGAALQRGPASSGPALAAGPDPEAAALCSQEQAEAQRLGLEEGLLPAGRRRLQAHALQQEIRSLKVDCQVL